MSQRDGSPKPLGSNFWKIADAGATFEAGSSAIDTVTIVACLVCSWLVCLRHNPEFQATLHSGQQTFASRKAYGLTYQCCRESGQFRGLYRMLGAETGIDPKNVERLMRDGF